MSPKDMMRTALSRFSSDQRGNMAVMFATCAVVVTGIIGAAVDFQVADTAEDRSQQISDAIALQGAIFVKNNGFVPGEEASGLQAGDYKASELGYEFGSFVDQGADGVNVNIAYDDNAKEVIVTVSGETNTTFTRVMGKETVPFRTVSVASYLEIDEAFPSSITLVLDNSGSMRWDDKARLSDGTRPSNAVPRIDALKKSVKTFRTDLRNRLGNERKADGRRVLRTGILPYNSEIKEWTNNAYSGMQWGYAGINNQHVDNMEPEGGTNSNPPMNKAEEWLSNEQKRHDKEAKDHGVHKKEILKFVIFMTDGQNTTGEYKFRGDDESPYWYRKFDYDGSGVKWWRAGRQFDPQFRQGYLYLASDEQTMSACDRLKADDEKNGEVIIFTIGYGLDVGEYWDPEYERYENVTPETNATATALMSRCASSPDHFVLAKNGEELEGAFDMIQNAIVEEIIRIKA